MKNIIIIGILCLFYGCSDWLTVMPKTEMPAEEMFKEEQGFKDALIGVYINLSQVYAVEGKHVSSFIEHIACQWDGFQQDSDEGKLNLHDYFDADDDITRMFQGLYKVVADINHIMGYMDNGVLKEPEYSEIKGELLALRAFVHFELIRLWGPIPTEAGSKEYLPYETKLQVEPYEYHSYSDYMDFLNEDLNEAERLLYKGVDSVNTTTPVTTFLEYSGLLALRSRVALWLNDKETAYQYAKKVYATKLFELGTISDINSGQYSFPKEHIFTLAEETSKTVFLDSYYVYDEILRTLIFGDETSDVRLSWWVEQEDDDEDADDDIKKMNCIKYNLPEQEGEDKDQELVVPIIRLAELYLIMMECADLDTANELYEEFCLARRCAYTPLTEVNIQSTLMSEYQKEFIGEGQLFYYYKRMGIKNMPRCTRPCGTAAYVLPLPRKEIDITY